MRGHRQLHQDLGLGAQNDRRRAQGRDSQAQGEIRATVRLASVVSRWSNSIFGIH